MFSFQYSRQCFRSVTGSKCTEQKAYVEGKDEIDVSRNDHQEEAKPNTETPIVRQRQVTLDPTLASNKRKVQGFR